MSQLLIVRENNFPILAGFLRDGLNPVSHQKYLDGTTGFLGDFSSELQGAQAGWAEAFVVVFGYE
jgi:hypothetical protein